MVTPRPWFERLQYPLLGAFLAVFLVVGWISREPPLQGAGDDEFVYLALSESLESGSYRETFRADQPWHVQYPPAYPAWLIPVRKLTGENLTAITASNLVLATLGLLVLFLAARQLLGVPIALGFLFLLTLNRSLLTASSLSSEGLFLLLASATLYWMLPRPDAPPRPAWPALVLALLAFLTRSIGLALVLAVGVWLWSRRDRRVLLAWGLASVLVVGGWLFYSSQSWADPTIATYASDFTAGMPESGGGVIAHLLGRVWKGGVTYATTHMPHAIALPTIPGTVVDNWLWLALTAFLMTVGLLLFWTRWRGAAVYVACYVGIVLLWPWESGRLLVPLVPFGLLALLLGARWVTGWLGVRAGRVAVGLLLAMLGWGAIESGWERLRLYRNCDREQPNQSAGCYDHWKLAIIAGAEFVRANGNPGDLVFTDQPASVAYFSGHLTLPAFIAWQAAPRTTAEVMRERGVRYILGYRSWHAERMLPSCAELRLEGYYPPEGLLLSLGGGSVPSGASAPGSDACQTMRRVADLQLPP